MRNKEQVQRDLDVVWSRLDSVLDKFWKELNNENRTYKINSLTRKRERLVKSEAKLLKELSKVTKKS